ncbi:Virginiamycin B lyase [Pelomyxa schiedti]|nr:Virginiamycin B lyase [Pelomyxa schiedti]
MATTMATASETSSPRELGPLVEYLTCPSCERFYVEVVLQCSHSFCTHCAKEFSKASGTIICPICKEPTDLPLGGVPALMRDHFSNSAALVLEGCGVLPLKTRTSSHCLLCKTGHATHWCVTCGELCYACSAKVHSTAKDHEVVARRSRARANLCKAHGEKLDLVCTICKKCFCHVCGKDKRLCRHNPSPFTEEALLAFKRDMPEIVNSLISQEAEVMEIKTIIHTNEKQVIDTATTVQELLKTTEAKLHKILTDKFAQLRGIAEKIVEKQVINIQAADTMILRKLGQLSAATALGMSVLTPGKTDNTGIHEMCEAGCMASQQARAPPVDIDIVQSAIDSQLRLELNSDIVEAAIESIGNVTETTIASALPPIIASSPAQGNLTTSGGRGFLDGPASRAQFSYPSSVIVDSDGFIFVADCHNHRIRKVTPEGEVTTFAGSGTPGHLDHNHKAMAQFNYPRGLALDPDGGLIVSDSGNHRVRKITQAGAVQTLSGCDTPGFLDGPWSAAQFNYPRCVTIDHSGNVLIADSDNNKIRCIAQDGSKTVFTLAGGFKTPFGVTVDNNGNLIVSDTGNHCIRRVTPDGATNVIAGIIGAPGFTDGKALTALFNRPLGLTIDSATGNLYISDFGNHRIRKLTPQGMVTTVLGDGNAGCSMNQLYCPSDVALDYSTTSNFNEGGRGASIYIVVADCFNHRIVRRALSQHEI